MERVRGLGGVFFRARDPQALAASAGLSIQRGTDSSYGNPSQRPGSDPGMARAAQRPIERVKRNPPYGSSRPISQYSRLDRAAMEDDSRGGRKCHDHPDHSVQVRPFPR